MNSFWSLGRSFFSTKSPNNTDLTSLKNSLDYKDWTPSARGTAVVNKHLHNVKSSDELIPQIFIAIRADLEKLGREEPVPSDEAIRAYWAEQQQTEGYGATNMDNPLTDTKNSKGPTSRLPPIPRGLFRGSDSSTSDGAYHKSITKQGGVCEGSGDEDDDSDGDEGPQTIETGIKVPLSVIQRFACMEKRIDIEDRVRKSFQQEGKVYSPRCAGRRNQIRAAIWSNEFRKEEKDRYIAMAAKGEIPLPQKSYKQLIKEMCIKFQKDIAELQGKVPVAAVMVLLVPDDGYVNTSNISSVPTKGRPGFVPWFQGLTESNQKRWLSVMAAYGQQMWDEQRNEFLFGDSVESTKLEPEQDNSGKRRVGKTSRSKERKKLGTGVEFLGSLPSKIEDFEVKPGMGRRNLQDLVRIGLKELWRASGWPGQPSWRNTALKKDNYWPQDIPQWWETGDPSKMTIDNCYKMLENMMEGAKGTIPEEQRIRYLPYNPEVAGTKDSDTKFRSKSSKMAKAITHVEIPGKNIEDSVENDGTEHPTGINDIKREKGCHESSDNMIEGHLTPKDKLLSPNGQDSNGVKSTGDQPPFKEVSGGNDAQSGDESGLPSTRETGPEVTAQNGGQSSLGWVFNNEGHLMGATFIPEKPEAEVLRGDETESQVGTRPADMDQDTENKREDSTEMRNKKGECSAELSTVKSVNSRKRPAGAEASIEPPAKRPKSENEQVNQGAVRRQPAIKVPSRFKR